MKLIKKKALEELKAIYIAVKSDDKPHVKQQSDLLKAFAEHYNKQDRNDYIGEDDIIDFLL